MSTPTWSGGGPLPRKFNITSSRTLKSRTGGWCKVCRERYPKGTLITYFYDVGWIHNIHLIEKVQDF